MLCASKSCESGLAPPAARYDRSSPTGCSRIEIDDSAKKDLSKLDRAVARRITDFIKIRLARLDNPRSVGEALNGPKFGELWKYRVGDYRIIAKIEDARLVVLVVRIGNRKEVYR